MSSWRAVCLTAGNELPVFAADRRCCQLFHLLRRVVLSVEYQPASCRAPGAGGAAVPLWPAAGTNAAMPARLLAGAAGRRVADADLAGAGSGPRAPAFIDDRKPAHAYPGRPDFPLPSPARLAHAAASGCGADCRRAVAVPAVAG